MNVGTKILTVLFTVLCFPFIAMLSMIAVFISMILTTISPLLSSASFCIFMAGIIIMFTDANSPYFTGISMVGVAFCMFLIAMLSQVIIEFLTPEHKSISSVWKG